MNSKAWVLAIAAAAHAAASQPLAPQVLVLAGGFALIGLPSCLLWSLIGAGAARVLQTPLQLRAFNLAMAALLALSVVPLLA